MTIKGNFKTILAGVDGSDNSDIAFTEAVELAKRLGAVLHVVEVVDNLHSAMPKDTVETQKELAFERLKDYVERAKDLGLSESIHISVEVGNPKNLLTDTLPERLNVDLIVIGATGKHFFKNSYLGSVSDYVANNAKCSVLVSR